jgi:phage gp29-like protein
MAESSLIAAGSASEMARVLAPYAGEELASAALVELLWPTSLGGFQELPHPSRILLEHEHSQGFASGWLGWRVGELYDKMLEDTDLGGLWQKRMKALLQLPRLVNAADSTPKALETAEFVRQALREIPQSSINLEHNIGGIFRGVAIQEIIWEERTRGPLAGAWLPADVIDRPMWRFTFHLATRRLYLRRRGSLPFEAPDFKFTCFTHGTKDNPWGKGLGDPLYWFWFIKRHAAKFWAMYVERFSCPAVDATYQHRQGGSPEAATFNEEQQRLLLGLIEAVRFGAGFVHPEGTIIKFLEASRGGDSSYSAFIGWLTRGMALLVLGEVDTSGLAKGPGSFAKSDVSNDVRLETVNHDAELLGSFETENLIKWIVMVNFGPDAPVPHMVYDAMDAGDRTVRSAGIQAALAAGEKVPRSYARRTWQIPALIAGEEVLEPPSLPAAPAQPAPALSFARLAANDLSPLGAAVEGRDADLQAVADLFLAVTTDYFAAQQASIVQLWGNGATPPADLLQQLMRGRQPTRHADALLAAQIHGAGLSMLHLRDEQVRTSPDRRLSFELPPDLARAASPATAEEFWRLLLALPRDVFDALVEPLRKVAFSAAGLAEATSLVEVQALLHRAIAESMDRATFVKELDELYQRLGLAPDSPWHAQLVYANNVRQASHLVRYQQTVGNKAAQRLLPYLFWWTVDDERVRHRPEHDHRVMHGFVAATDHPVWQTWWPLAGHNDRCGIGTINVVEARRRGLTGSEPSGPWPLSPETGARAMPDPGFVGAPNLEQIAARIAGQLRDLAGRAAADGSDGDLSAALSALFASLGLSASGGLS